MGIILLQIATVLASFVLVIGEIASIATYGWFLSSGKWSEYVMKQMDDGYINSYNVRIVGFNGHGYLSTCSLSLLAKWYVYDVGLIFRWSKLHRLVEEKYMKKLQEYTSH